MEEDFEIKNVQNSKLYRLQLW